MSNRKQKEEGMERARNRREKESKEREAEQKRIKEENRRKAAPVCLIGLCMPSCMSLNCVLSILCIERA